MSLVPDYQDGKCIPKRQCFMKDHILWLTVRDLNAAINCAMWISDPEIGYSGSSQTHLNLRVHWNRDRIDPLRGSRMSCCKSLQPSWTISVDWTRTAGKLPSTIANTVSGMFSMTICRFI
jgi:hypothetical protein